MDVVISQIAFFALIVYSGVVLGGIISGHSFGGALKLPLMFLGIYQPSNIPDGWEIVVTRRDNPLYFKYVWHVRRIGMTNTYLYSDAYGYADTRRGAIFAADQRLAASGPWSSDTDSKTEVIRNTSSSVL